MSQQNNGETESKVEDAVKKIHAQLTATSEVAGLRVTPIADIAMYINYDEDMFKHMDAEDAATAAYMVSRHAIYVKKTYNRELAICKWARSVLNGIAIKKAKQYVDDKYLKLEEKIAVVVGENEYAKEVHKQLMASELKATELYDMHDQLNKLSDKLTDIHRSKRYQR